MTSARAVVIPLGVSVLGAFLGMFLPVAAFEFTHSDSFHPHSVFWESVFGLGFYVAGFFGSCMSDRWVAIVGFAVWPVVGMILIFLATRRILRMSGRGRVIWTTIFVVSLLVYVGQRGENYLSVHHVPLYWNLYAVCY